MNRILGFCIGTCLQTYINGIHFPTKFLFMRAFLSAVHRL